MLLSTLILALLLTVLSTVRAPTCSLPSSVQPVSLTNSQVIKMISCSSSTVTGSLTVTSTQSDTFQVVVLNAANYQLYQSGASYATLYNSGSVSCASTSLAVQSDTALYLAIFCEMNGLSCSIKYDFSSLQCATVTTPTPTPIPASQLIFNIYITAVSTSTPSISNVCSFASPYIFGIDYKLASTDGTCISSPCNLVSTSPINMWTQVICGATNVFPMISSIQNSPSYVMIGFNGTCGNNDFLMIYSIRSAACAPFATGNQISYSKAANGGQYINIYNCGQDSTCASSSCTSISQLPNAQCQTISQINNYAYFNSLSSPSPSPSPSPSVTPSPSPSSTSSPAPSSTSSPSPSPTSSTSMTPSPSVTPSTSNNSTITNSALSIHVTTALLILCILGLGFN